MGKSYRDIIRGRNIEQGARYRAALTDQRREYRAAKLALKESKLASSREVWYDAGQQREYEGGNTWQSRT